MSKFRGLVHHRRMGVALTASCLAGALVVSLLSAAGWASAASAGPASASSLKGSGSVDEAWLTGAAPGDTISLLHNGTALGSEHKADSLGSLIVRRLDPAAGYRWRDVTSGETTPTFSVLAPHQNPSVNSSLYTDQPMHKGLNYIRMRDGILLAATVRYPYGVTCSAKAPCPTVIEYSGYGTAAPTDPIPYVIAEATGGSCNKCGDPNLLPDSSTYVGALVARVAGFATVSLQMRGSGCSGGAYDLFGYPSDYDAYDAIEIVAHQSWVAHHHVGMVGISYSGLSEFPSAGTDPPGLAAIAPLSPTDDLFSTGFPGGIYNDGFAASWIGQRSDDAKPAAKWSDGQLVPLARTPVSNVAQPWTYYEIDAERRHGGTSTCLANQALHDEVENTSFLASPKLVAPGSGPGREKMVFDRRSMRDWASHIRVPVYVAGALEDDETGPQWPALLSALPKTTPVYATMVNGGHIDSTMPAILSRWLEFLDVYVAEAVPKDPGALGDLVLDEFEGSAAGTTANAPLPPFRFTSASSYTAALHDFATHTPRVRVLFDNGAGSIGAGDPESTYASTFTSWPPAGRVRTLYLGDSGALGAKPGDAGSATFALDPSARPATDLPSSGNPWAADPPWDWTTVPAADGVAFQTPTFSSNKTFVGPATLDLWVESATPVDDFQVTVGEARPGSGTEEYITSGFLRSSNTALEPDSTALFTDPTYIGSQSTSLSAGQFHLIKIPIDPIVHTFRKGTALRVTVEAPGGDRPLWAFDSIDDGQSVTIGTGGQVASALVVNEVKGVQATSTLPTCGTLRGEPCRTLQDEGNQ